MHGSVGSSCAVADVQGDKATVWSPTQGVWHERSTLAVVLCLQPVHVHVVFRRGSGGHGINAADKVTYDAALLSQAVGKPVRVQITRKDEMAWENYGFAFVMDEFFFSSRRRHTISLRDWSSDVCSSDLSRHRAGPGPTRPEDRRPRVTSWVIRGPAVPEGSLGTRIGGQPSRLANR